MLVKERKNLVPAVDRRFGPIIRTIMRKEGVPGAVVAVELVFLAVFFELRLGAVDLIGRRVRVVVAEQTEERAADAGGVVDGRHRLRLAEPRLVVDDDIAAPAIDRSLDQMR